jgi:hypothetical protein
MTKRTILLIATLLTLSALAGAPTRAQDPGETDSLWIDSVTAFINGIGVVPISFYNDASLDLIEVTVSHTSPLVKIDSFSFAGGRVDVELRNNEALLDTDSMTLAIVSLSFGGPPVPVGRGLLGNVYYSWPQSIAPQQVPIDTVTWFQGLRKHTTSFTDFASGQTYIPWVSVGNINIAETPASFDSVWVDDVEAAPGDPVEVGVCAFNERNLATVQIALDYTSELLLFDSVSFVATRSEGAPSKTVQPQTSLHKVYMDIEFGEASPLMPGDGLMAVMHFTVDPSADERVIPIDSTTVGIISNTRFHLTAADGGLNFVPIFKAGSVEVKISTDVEDISDGVTLPADYSLAQNYPNPFNPSTNMEFSLPEATHVSLEVFNILGQNVRRLLDRDMPAGVHRVVFDGRNDRGTRLATGVYFYRMVTDQGYQETKKMLMLK